jgi:transposase
MARNKGPRRTHRYTAEFKLKAVKLSGLEGVQVQDVAEALDIHPIMLTRWRKEAREGLLRGRIGIGPGVREQREMTEFSKLKREHALLKEEHELLKKPSGSVPNEGRGLRLHRRGAGPVWDKGFVPAVRSDAVGVLRMARPGPKRAEKAG